MSARQVQQRGSQFQTNAGLGYDTDDDAGRSTGDQYTQHAFGTVDQTVDKIFGGNTGALTQAGADDGQRNCIQSGPHGSITGNQQVNDDNQRNGQMTFFPQQFAKLRQFFPRRTFQAILFGFKVNADPDTGVIQHRRNDGCLNYINIRNAYKFRHQESCRAHNRRHQLAAGGSRCFYRAGKSGTVAQLFHHGDGKGTGTCYVGNRRSGYRTHQAGGQNRNFSRTAYGPAGQSVRRINKELAKSGGFQISAEQNEQVNERGRYAHRHTEDTFRRKVQMTYQFVKAHTAMRHDSRHVRTGKRIRQKD